MIKKRIVSGVAFYDEQNRILLQDRRNIKKYGEEWGFFGGAVEDGEGIEDALKREIKEELQYKLTKFEFFKKYRGFIGDLDCILYVHLAKFPGFDSFNQQEGDGMKLFAGRDIGSLKLVDIDRKILNDIFNFLSVKN